jgi:hypothetical protein
VGASGVVGRDPALRKPCHAADDISPHVVFSGGKPLVTEGWAIRDSNPELAD